MKKWVVLVIFLLTVIFPLKAKADGPIYTGLLWDTAPQAAYNPDYREFLVVWTMYNVLYPPTDINFFGPVMGQRITENGERISDPFMIFPDGGVLPDVAYNAARKEYLVVAERNYNCVGQRVTPFGMTLGGPTTFLTAARFPRVVYNSLSMNYLVIGAWLTETGGGLCSAAFHSTQVNGSGQPFGSVNFLGNDINIPCQDGPTYAVDYGPVVSAKTPQGRYLLALGTPERLRMLDSQGALLLTLYDPDHHSWDYGIPFESTKVGIPYGVNMAFGKWQGKDSFLLVWGDTSLSVSGYGTWTGIWGGIVDAETEVYNTNDGVYNHTVPISYQYSHWALPEHAKTWRPAAAYNSTADTFAVTWRETPGSDPNDPTDVNHIRVNTVKTLTVPPGPNLVVSATTGSEDPTLPCIAASSDTTACLMAWEDHRNLFGVGDIYGSHLNATAKTISDILPPESGPPGPGGTKSYWKTASGGRIYSQGLYHQGVGTQGYELRAWGNNNSGQLGIGVGDTTDRHITTRVGSYSDWTGISAGGKHSLGIRSNGSLLAWGYNNSGQLGIGVGDTTNRHIPTQVGSYSDWISISAGLYYSLGIRSNGSLSAWGVNHSGQLGIGVGDTTERHIPTRVGSYSDWISISAGGAHSLGIRSNGSLWAWGYNADGELGLGDTTNRHTPRPVAPFPPCPQCTGDPVVLTNVTFPPGTACECAAATSITIGATTEVESDGTVHFKSPTVTVQSGARFESGSDVKIKQ